MEALLLRDAVYVNDRYQELQDQRRHAHYETVEKEAKATAVDADDVNSSLERSNEHFEHWQIVNRAMALDKQEPTSTLRKKFSVLDNILESLYAENEDIPFVTSPSKAAANRLDKSDGNSPVPFKELPLPTQIALKMFFRACQSLRDPTRLAVNCRLSVQIASRLPAILTTMPSCVLSPGLVDDSTPDSNGENIWSVFHQLFGLFEELLGSPDKDIAKSEQVCLPAGDRATIVTAYVALSLKWGRLGYLLKAVEFLLESCNEISGQHLGMLGPLFRELALVTVDLPQTAFDEEDKSCGYLMSFGKGDHGKLGHGQCTHVSCQEGNCTENKIVPTIIAATKDIEFRKIDSLSTHSIAITTKGEAMAWGNGDKYRLGHGSSAKEYSPRAIEFLSSKGRVRDLACGLGHTLALMESGELYAWGNGSNGRLGVGDMNDRSSPTKVIMPTSVAKLDEEDPLVATANAPVRFRHIFCGASHSLGISLDGRAYAWGKNNQGQCGHGHSNDQLTIQEIECFRDSEEMGEEESVVYAAGGWEHTLFCTASGRVYSCGSGYKDSRRAGIPPVLGHGDYDRRLKPTLVQAFEDVREEIVKVACGWDHSLAVSASGRVYTWGSGTNGKLGHGDEENCDIPTLVRSMENKPVKEAKAGCEHTVFLTHDHELWTCGQGDSGRLGHGDSQTRKRPTKVELFAKCGLKPVALAVGDKYNLVLVTDGDGMRESSGQTELNAVPHAHRMEHSPSKRSDFRHSRHRGAQHKRTHDAQFGPNWVLNLVKAKVPNANAMNNSDASSNDAFPSSVTDAALFIIGHMDRLAMTYLADAYETVAEKRLKSRVSGTESTSQTLFLPFAVDTSCQSFQALLRLLRRTLASSGAKENLIWMEKGGHNGLSLMPQERMGLTLSCLRILQLNLKKVLDLPCIESHSFNVAEAEISRCAGLAVDLFNDVHKLLDSLAALTGDSILERYHGENHRPTETQIAIGNAVSLEAACALKMGFAKFYPPGHPRITLLWKISGDCEREVLSMRTVILSGQLSNDSIMKEIFRTLYSQSISQFLGTISDNGNNEVNAQKGIVELKMLMIGLLRRSGAEAIRHLDNEAFADFAHKPDCFLRLLHVLQTHYFSSVHRVVFQRYPACGDALLEGVNCASSDTSTQILDYLLDYVECLLAEALSVLKKLHKGSRQHEDIITWRLNGSFFHILLPSAVECLSLLLLPANDPEKASTDVVNYAGGKLLLVERVMPNLHAMLKMLDEVSWKMHNTGDGGNQTRDVDAPHHSFASRSVQDENWFVELGDACAILCGRLSCELLYSARSFKTVTSDVVQNDSYYALVLSEGLLLDESQLRSDKEIISKPIGTILEWERLGVFEVEDELESNPSGSTGSLPIHSFDDQHFLTQLTEPDFLNESMSFWHWVSKRVSTPMDVLTSEIYRLLTAVISVASWHLCLTEEFRHCFELYKSSSDSSTVKDYTDSDVPGRIFKCFSALCIATKRIVQLRDSIDENALANAIAVSRFFIKLQPNPSLLPHMLEGDLTSTKWACASDFVMCLVQFLLGENVRALQRALSTKDVDIALSRTGICILHDLLRKLTTSSTKSYLLGEFVSATCTRRSISPIAIALKRQGWLNQDKDKCVRKAVENLFVRLARIISSEDASFNLKKKALLAWTIPLSLDKGSIPNVVGLIAKSGVVNTLIELLLDEVNVLDTHSEINPSEHYHEAETKVPAKLAPVRVLLFSQTPSQTISFLAWEAFCAISTQLSKSEIFAQQRPTLFLRCGGSNSQDREPLTPRNASMSPRRRLTLPKKTIISTIDEIFEQMIDGLFLMLKKAAKNSDTLDCSAQKLLLLLAPSSISKVTESQHENSSRIFLIGCPIHISQSSAHEVKRVKPDNLVSDGTMGLTLSFWLYVEHRGAITKSPNNCSLEGKSACVMGFGPEQDANSATTESAQNVNSASFIVFVRDTDLDRISLGISVRYTEDKTKQWQSIPIDDSFPQEKWVHVAIIFAKEAPERIKVFVDGRCSTLNHSQSLTDKESLFCSSFLKNISSWTSMTAGGHIDSSVIGNKENQNGAPNLPSLPKSTSHGFSAILDDVMIIRGALSQDTILQVRSYGTIIFWLKQQNIATNYSTEILRLLCLLVGDGVASSKESPLPLVPYSERWLDIFMHILLSICRKEDFGQVYLCHLLQHVLPQVPLLPDFDIKGLGRNLFSVRAGCAMTASRSYSEKLVEMFNTRNKPESQNATMGKQNEALWRMMHQRGILTGKLFSGKNTKASDLTHNKLSAKAELSLKFAAGVQLFQSLCCTPSWAFRMEQFVAASRGVFQSASGLEEILENNDSGAQKLAEITAVVNMIAGYSEESLNEYRASLPGQAVLSLGVQSCTAPYDSVARIDNTSSSQTTCIRELIGDVLKDELQHRICLSARQDLLSKCRKDSAIAYSMDETIGSVLHLQARMLRFLMVALQREQCSSTREFSWHHFVLEDISLTDNLLRLASSHTKEYVTSVLGPDAKLALRLRRLRFFTKEVLRGSKRRPGSATKVSLIDLERLQWRLWEEIATPSLTEAITPWWQQSTEENGKALLEVVGGDVELLNLKVKALEHFPTVKLTQANICANTGLWFYEVVVLTDGLMQIGYVDGDFTADALQGQGVGDHSNSWAFDGFRCKKWNVNSYDYGENWRVDDVVGVLLDSDRMEISYFLNGKFLGVAFSGVAMTATSRMCPAASLNVHQTAQFNFGASKVTTLSEGGHSVNGNEFQHLPTLDNDDDQARLRPVIFAVENRLTTTTSDTTTTTSNLANQVDEKTCNDPPHWSDSSSDSDSTEDGEITLDTSGNLIIDRSPGLISRDGSEVRTASPIDEGIDHRRRDLIEGLTGLGFPLELATRCASESSIPTDENGAVTWILEQMQKAGLDGASMPGSISNDDGIDAPDRSTTPWGLPLSLPAVQSFSDIGAESCALAVEQARDNVDDLTTEVRNSEKIAVSIPQDVAHLLMGKQATASARVNVFLDSEKQGQQSDDAAIEAFPCEIYTERGLNLLTEMLLSGGIERNKASDTHVIDNKRGIDDLLPLSVSVDSSICVAYARHSFVSLLLLALEETEEAKVYKMIESLLQNDESSSRFYRFLEMALGFDTLDVMFEIGSVPDDLSSKRSLRLQQTLIALLNFEIRHTTTLDSDKTNATESRLPLFESLCKEMLRQCDRGLSSTATLSSKKQAGKMIDPVTMQSAAVWFAWISSISLGFVESQMQNSSSTGKKTAIKLLAGVVVSPFYSTSYLENLVVLASRSSMSWKYVALRLISRMLLIVKKCEKNRLIANTSGKTGDENDCTPVAAVTPSEFFASAQLVNLADLFTLRRRREMHSRIFFSDLTCALFTILARASGSLYQEISMANAGSHFHVNNYSSTHVSISWEQPSFPTSPVPLVTGSSDTIVDDESNDPTKSKTEAESSIMVLEVKRYGHHLAATSDDDETISTKVLPPKGTYTARNLLPDTKYLFRLMPLSGDTCDISTITGTGDSRRETPANAAELIVQTLPDPIFELDRDSMGKNVLVFNQNLSAKNTINKKWNSVRASVAFDEGVHQWQVRLDTCVSKNIFIGICTEDASMENYIGSDAFGYGFLANKAVWHNKAKLQTYGEIFKQGDVIQVTLDCNAKTLAFSRNGEYLGIAASNLRAGGGRSSSSLLGSNAGGETNCKWYPAFSMYNKDDKLTLVPPPDASAFSAQGGRPQNASTLALVENMQNVLAYQEYMVKEVEDPWGGTNVFGQAFTEFENWKRGEMAFREISLGQVIAINTRKSATEKYGLAANDSVFTPKGQCVVIGEYRHELWYEIDEAVSPSLLGVTSPQLASWNLSTCREMLESPDEFPVHRHQKYKLEADETTTATATTEVEASRSCDPHDSDASSADAFTFSLQSFVEVQKQWSSMGNAVKMDARLIADLDAIATSQSLSSPQHLSFSDISAALTLEKFHSTLLSSICGIGDLSPGLGFRHVLARIGFLLHVNRCLYNVVRVAIPRNVFASSLGVHEGSAASKKLQTSGLDNKQASTSQEYHLVPSVAVLMNSPRWALEDPSSFAGMPELAARLLFSSQKECIIDEELRKTRTPSRDADNADEPLDRENGEQDNDIPTIEVSYPPVPATPFWECNPKQVVQKCCRLPGSIETTIFAQLVKQLAVQDAREWRRESSLPFETIPISQAFRVSVEKVTTETSEQQQGEEDEEQQPPSKQTAQYLQLFECASREIQSPGFPLFTPEEESLNRAKVSGIDLSQLQLDINTELFSPSALASSRLHRSKLLLWFYCFGQLLGIAWRSKLLLPLQFLSLTFWQELMNPNNVDLKIKDAKCDRLKTRATAISAIRDGLFSIIPSRCVALLNGSNPGLRERLSDLDVGYVVRLECHAVYLIPRQTHHDSLWKILNAFSSVERRMLEQFVNPERRRQLHTSLEFSIVDDPPPATFVLEIAEALSDGRDHPDSCYPVVVPVGPHSSRLHLPAYSNAQTLRHKLLLAMTNVPFM